MEENKVWISNNILEWDYYSDGGSFISREDRERAYDIWAHAADLIDTAQNNFNLADGITNLKRSLNQRLQLIEKVYQLKTINIPNKPKGYLELLELLGLVRPYIMKQLFEVRNDIEHRDSPPPNKIRCSELLDVVWYFLKSTDPFVQLKKSGLNFELLDNEGNDTHYWFSLNWNFEDEKSSSINGWFPEEYIVTTEKKEGFIEVIYEKYYGKEKWVNAGKHNDKLDTDIYLSGKINQINIPNVVNKVLTSF
ncbi:hypothetical protein [Guptibacillus spartinae]|uniref:hypothetical protein n=1 Tax=Guptibacillus spartinae TaxID=3025679 RepID=UPI00235E31B7|nr:hypothetical protein [Pseudalkalibacillus spartinae]